MPQIIPIRDLKNTSDISNLCHTSEEPIFITKNGYGDMVIMSMETYENSMWKSSLYRELEQSEKQIREGRTQDARTALTDLGNKYGL
ncbi:type II toxin-antitoxin system Phd/YefM family antitoxin [Enterocloster bolteae]|uniref:type II toxin-antitoxin system Phd/YefM family antitoxin n=1 Tax=Enterocloster bolteae TaxID=208479 RepID=UPI0004053265|nr:type II toxin-antitoxin system Phd/YefM family antitoxin [Enterocloster bolteae]UOX68002.1 type II toxin-antitoxin system Phd/YefM family antitoxin [Enterocloster bolteae]